MKTSYLMTIALAVSPALVSARHVENHSGKIGDRDTVMQVFDAAEAENRLCRAEGLRCCSHLSPSFTPNDLHRCLNGPRCHIRNSACHEVMEHMTEVRSLSAAHRLVLNQPYEDLQSHVLITRTRDDMPRDVVAVEEPAVEKFDDHYGDHGYRHHHGRHSPLDKKRPCPHHHQRHSLSGRTHDMDVEEQRRGKTRTFRNAGNLHDLPPCPRRRRDGTIPLEAIDEPCRVVDHHDNFMEVMLAFFFFVGTCTLLLLPFIIFARSMRRMVRCYRRDSTEQPQLRGFRYRHRRANAAPEGYEPMQDTSEDDDGIVVTGTPVNPPPSVNV